MTVNKVLSLSILAVIQNSRFASAAHFRVSCSTFHNRPLQAVFCEPSLGSHQGSHSQCTQFQSFKSQPDLYHLPLTKLRIRRVGSLITEFLALENSWFLYQATFCGRLSPWFIRLTITYLAVFPSDHEILSLSFMALDESCL